MCVLMNDYVYPYRAMLEKLLSYGDEAKTTHLQSELFYKDTAGAMEDMKDKNKNEGFLERYRYCKNNEDIEMTGRLHLDILQQDRLLLNKVDMTVMLNRSASEFCLMSSTKKQI